MRMLYRKLINFIEKNKLFTKAESLLLSLSGGIDSVVLLDLLCKGGYNFEIIHFNFKLRAIESDQDEEFVHKLASVYKKKLHIKSFQTKEYSLQKRISIQMAARKLRYEWLEKLSQELNINKILTAHHLNDNIETIVFNLTKGCGLSGLRGIPLKNNKIIRPLLSFTKKEIEDYATSNHLTWREDSSNSKDYYSRNLIRHKVIPILKQINPNIEKSFQRTIDRLSSSERLQLETLEQQKEKVLQKSKCQNEYKIKLADIDTLEWGFLLLNYILKQFNFNEDQVNIILDSFTHKGAFLLSSTHKIIIDKDEINIIPRGKEEEIYNIDIQTKELRLWYGSLKFEILPNGADYPKDPRIACLDMTKLKFPLTVRQWSQGDIFYPLGLRHKKKVSDFFIDSKVSNNEKRKTYILISNGDIAAILGYRIDDRYKVAATTDSIYKINLVT